MDAKPQRPFRPSFRVRDENAPPPGLAAKQIHNRNKSSPALSTLAKQHGALNTGPRRTAFADVSNTARPTYTIQDDSAITKMRLPLENIKELPVQETAQHPAPILRPPQRPQSVSGLKGLLSSFTSNNNHNNTNAAAAATTTTTTTTTERNSSVHQLINLKKVSKPPVGSENLPKIDSSNPPPSALPELPHISQSCNVLPDVDASKPAEVSSKPLQDAPRRPNTSASHSLQPSEHPLPQLPSSDQYDIRSDGVRLSRSHSIATSQVSQGIDYSHSYSPPKPYIATEREAIPSIEDKILSHISMQEVNEDPQMLFQPIFPEHWDDGGYAPRDEDEDYSTLRSIKSRAGENTTSQTTVILAPKVTTKVQQELAEAKQYIQQTQRADEIEEDESWDTSMVAEYSEEIFEYMSTLEERMRPNPYYMDNQTEVQWSMRSVLMDWLVQVHHRFSLLPETLFLCANYIDRFLSCKVVSLGKLQLVGATAIFIAAKYEEINCPSVSEIQYMVDGGYTVDEILKAERFMLSMLQFELGWPGPMSFLRRISKADDYDLETRTLAKYFLEITMMDERFVGCIPSYTAAGAHCLARLMLGKGSWSQAHVYYSNYTYSQLRPLISTILSCCEDPQKHHSAVFDKYGDKRFKRASYFVQSEMSKGFGLPRVSRSSERSFGELNWNRGSYLGNLKVASDSEDLQFPTYIYDGNGLV